MKLYDAQIAEFEERGYLFFPGLLDSDEVGVLQGAVPDILSRRGPLRSYTAISCMGRPTTSRRGGGRSST
jgi:hypothetical protein